jgi:hypothetical protein
LDHANVELAKSKTRTQYLEGKVRELMDISGKQKKQLLQQQQLLGATPAAPEPPPPRTVATIRFLFFFIFNAPFCKFFCLFVVP